MNMIYKKSQKLFAFAFLFFVSTLFTSCGIWTNFTTYFNTYYNAKTLFQNAEDELEKQNRDPFIFREEDQLINQKNIPGQNRNVTQPTTNLTNKPAKPRSGFKYPNHAGPNKSNREMLKDSSVRS